MIFSKKILLILIFVVLAIVIFRSEVFASCWNYSCTTYASDCNGPDNPGADLCANGSFTGTVNQDANPCTDGVTVCNGNLDGGTGSLPVSPVSCSACGEDAGYTPAPTGCAAYGMLPTPCPTGYSTVTIWVSLKPNFFKKKNIEVYYASLMKLLGMPVADAGPVGDGGGEMTALTCCVYDPVGSDCTCPSPCTATGDVAGYGPTSCTNNTVSPALSGACGTCPSAAPSCVDQSLNCTAPTTEVGCY